MENGNMKIIKKIGSFPVGNKDWNMELNIISWFGRTAQYDIRPFGKRKGEQAWGKGLVLSKEELIQLRDLLNKVEID